MKQKRKQKRQTRDAEWHKRFEQEIVRIKEELARILGINAVNKGTFNEAAFRLFFSTVKKEHLLGLYAYSVLERLQVAQRFVQSKYFDEAESKLKFAREALVQAMSLK